MICWPINPPAPVTHATGFETALTSIDQSPRDIPVSVNATVAKKRPMGASYINFIQITTDNESFLFDCTLPLAISRPEGFATKLCPQNSIPSPPHGFSNPMRLTTAT